MADNMGEIEQAEVPATDVPSSESTEQVVDQPHVDVQETPETETGTNEEVSEAPKDNKAWAAMRAENKRLKEAVSTVDPGYLENLHRAVAPQEYAPSNVPQVTGDDDYNKVTQGVNFATQQATIANQKLQKLQNQLELQQDREAERAFPELKANKVFQQIVSEKKLVARVLGHDRTTYEIADEVSKQLGLRDEQVAAKAVENTKQQILQRQVISSEPKGTSSSGRSAVDNEDLRMRVRKGDSKAQEEVAKGLIADLEF